MKIQFCVLSVLLLAACQDEEGDKVNTLPQAGSVAEYSLLKKGNYWVYQEYLVDSNGIETPVPNEFDTVRVSGDSLIGGVKYSWVSSQKWYSDLLRDSADVLLSAYTGTVFSPSYPGKLLKQSFSAWADYELWMLKEDVQVPTKWGLKRAKGTEVIYTFPPSSLGPNARFPVFKGATLWVKGIGKVMGEFCYASAYTVEGTKIRLKLVDYYIQ